MSSIEVSDDGQVRVITLNRPEVRNALSKELRHELRTALAEADTDASVRVVVLTGAGDAFCAGLDLRELESTVTSSREENLANSTALAELFLAIIESPKPVVAARSEERRVGKECRYRSSRKEHRDDIECGQ